MRSPGRDGDAEAFPRRTLERWPEDHHPSYELAELLRCQARFDEAAAVYRRLIDDGHDGRGGSPGASTWSSSLSSSPVRSAVPIARALAWLGAAVAGGVAGNAAYDLIKLMTSP